MLHHRPPTRCVDRCRRSFHSVAVRELDVSRNAYPRSAFSLRGGGAVVLRTSRYG
jgi:hypothetical protein